MDQNKKYPDKYKLTRSWWITIPLWFFAGVLTYGCFEFDWQRDWLLLSFLFVFCHIFDFFLLYTSVYGIINKLELFRYREMPIMIKHVLLDLDDTILDFHAAERVALAETFAEVGVEVSEDIMRRYSEINVEGWQMLERGVKVALGSDGISVYQARDVLMQHGHSRRL